MIRIANPSDAGALQALMKSVADFWDENWRADLLECVLAAPETIAVVHETNHMIDGFACAHDVGFRAYLSELVVAPASQRRGIGGRLLSDIERRLAERGCSTVIADVWREADGFYRSADWASPRAVLLRKRLAANPHRATEAPTGNVNSFQGPSHSPTVGGQTEREPRS
jgi:ribosomal protein S18 acetylase RimI-like enzyme